MLTTISSFCLLCQLYQFIYSFFLLLHWALYPSIPRDYLGELKYEQINGSHRVKFSPGTVRAPVFGRFQFFGTSEHYRKAHGSLLSGWMNYNSTACCWFPTSSNILILPSQFWQIRFESYWLHCSKCRILVLLRYWSVWVSDIRCLTSTTQRSQKRQLLAIRKLAAFFIKSANQRPRKMNWTLDIKTVTGKFFLGCRPLARGVSRWHPNYITSFLWIYGDQTEKCLQNCGYVVWDIPTETPYCWFWIP